MIVRSLQIADDEVLDAVARLEREQPGYGVSLKKLFRSAVGKIKDNPRFYSPTEDGPEDVETREYFIARFEYRLIYVVLETELVILGLIHARRRPESWTDRLKML